jgi:hypothetical protein
MPSEIVFFHALIYINLETLYDESQSECWKKCCRDYVLLSTYCLVACTKTFCIIDFVLKNNRLQVEFGKKVATVSRLSKIIDF